MLHIKEVWGSTPQGNNFYSYFLVHIAEDMKNRMILPIRKAAGLGDNFYYNNGTESINSSLKSEIEKSKKAIQVFLWGICKNCQCFRELISSQRSLGSCWRWSLQTGSQLSAFGSYRRFMDESVEERKSGKNKCLGPGGS